MTTPVSPKANSNQRKFRKNLLNGLDGEEPLESEPKLQTIGRQFKVSDYYPRKKIWNPTAAESFLEALESFLKHINHLHCDKIKHQHQEEETFEGQKPKEHYMISKDQAKQVINNRRRAFRSIFNFVDERLLFEHKLRKLVTKFLIKMKAENALLKIEIRDTKVTNDLMLNSIIPPDLTNINITKMVDDNIEAILNNDAIFELLVQMKEQQDYTKEVKKHVAQMYSDIEGKSLEMTPIVQSSVFKGHGIKSILNAKRKANTWA